MKKLSQIIFGVGLVSVLFSANLALAANLIMAPDLPVGAVPSANGNPTGLGIDPNIAAALIGVIGVLVGSAVTIVATLFMRNLDIKREEQREKAMIEENRKEKEYQIKQEIYKDFLKELSLIEAFHFKNIEDFKREWIKTEVKVDLVASNKLRDIKETLQSELYNIAEKNIKSGSANLSSNYLKLREHLLEAIREDIGINQGRKK